ncbi:hypothetical protein [Spirulina sp. CCNP1310]|uniref:hypothetical protein n=1 Tax=Spirulina sp. CCNP1310 TaxID=3110249 RepID=UPI002B21C0EF|nr:hypothetical protein [Spirulina sp. CCNP1310]
MFPLSHTELDFVERELIPSLGQAQWSAKGWAAGAEDFHPGRSLRRRLKQLRGAIAALTPPQAKQDGAQ